MPTEAPTYDLILLLSTSVPEDQRKKILGDIGSAISGGGGSIERNDDWGVRRLSYLIGHQPDAEYHLLQFTCPPSLLENLSHDLGITDAVMRFRIIKMRAGTPPAPESAPPVVVPAAPESPPEE